ncbi:hypothetical protein CTI12_AA343020 [Artemisia annua]|uniref:Uncharacterized protein n=1 Tax=Artemisia annua TaxID=35608 RepID=A0A2U1MTA0_ARTAN|nr:hypothetical protein CTI12_AA343020 [Artemisia annua]
MLARLPAPLLPSSPDPEAKENSLPVTSDKKSKQGRKRKSSTPTVKSPSSAKKNKLSQNKIQEKILKRSPRAASAPKTTPQQKSGVKLTIKLALSVDLTTGCLVVISGLN